MKESGACVMFLRVITAAQCRAARGLLGWSQQNLAIGAGIGIVTLYQFEAGVSRPRRATLEVIRRAFESAGIQFIEENGGGAGLRFKKKTPENPIAWRPKARRNKS